MRSEIHDGAARGGFDGEAEARGEAHGAHEPQPVLLKTLPRLANGADETRLDVLAAADEVDEFLVDRIIHHSVDGEIPATDVAFDIGKGDGCGVPAVGVGAVGAERGDLDLEALFHHDHDAELLAHGDGPGEEAADLVGRGGGRHVVVGGLAVHDHVAHAAAREIGFMPRRPERLHDLHGQLT